MKLENWTSPQIFPNLKVWSGAWLVLKEETTLYSALADNLDLGPRRLWSQSECYRTVLYKVILDSRLKIRSATQFPYLNHVHSQCLICPLVVLQWNCMITWRLSSNKKTEHVWTWVIFPYEISQEEIAAQRLKSKYCGPYWTLKMPLNQAPENYEHLGTEQIMYWVLPAPTERGWGGKHWIIPALFPLPGSPTSDTLVDSGGCQGRQLRKFLLPTPSTYTLSSSVAARLILQIDKREDKFMSHRKFCMYPPSTSCWDSETSSPLRVTHLESPYQRSAPLSWFPCIQEFSTRAISASLFSDRIWMPIHQPLLIAWSQHFTTRSQLL